MTIAFTVSRYYVKLVILYGCFMHSAVAFGNFIFCQNKNDSSPFWELSFAFIGLWLAIAAVHFPNLIKASNDQNLSITIYNSSTGLQTLKLMSVIALIGMPVYRLYDFCLPHF